MKKLKFEKFKGNKRFKAASIFTLIFGVIFITLMTTIPTDTYFLKEGDISDVDIKAPWDVEDKVATRENKKKEVEKVTDKFTFKDGVKRETTDSIDELFSKVIEINGEISLDNAETTEENGEEEDSKTQQLEQDKLLTEKIEKLKKDIGLTLSQDDLTLSDENLKVLFNLTPKEQTQLKEYLKLIMNKLYDNKSIYQVFERDDSGSIIDKGIKTEDLLEAQNYIKVEFNKSPLSNKLKELGSSIGYQLINPNYVYDAKGTQKSKEEAEASVQPVIVRKGQFIVTEGSIITEAQIELLKEADLLKDDDKSIWASYGSLVIFIIIILLLQWYYLFKYHDDIFYDTKKIMLIGVVTCISLILARSVSVLNIYLIPLAFSPMLLALLINDNVAMTISIVNVLFISVATQFNIVVTLLSIINAIAGVLLLKNMEQRNDILYSSMYIGIINGVALSSLLLINTSTEVMEIIINVAVVFLGSVFSGILTIGFLPFFESIFDIVTNVKLLELSNPNHPLLRKLSMEAPGTYHHSLLVANLSELAAQEIGANSILARVAAYYHDLGKTKRPYFFRENQRGENPHDKITPNLSTLIIISHVKDGIELAKEYKLPKEVVDIIKQHHGTTLVKYFYITMKNNSDKPEEVKEEDFRYAGPIPSSKEAGIVMLADSVEAAVRSISEPTKGKIEEMVNNIIKGKLGDGQLDNCDLTLKDLDNIRKAFLKGLSGIYHERIEYPKLTNKNE